ncbi:MAG: DUF1080 domain-containing protein [Candidatus Hydrogenedentes bacterium]|nr:DUF1080 domain-containing protein [Candidatus Hydrogenedentota bacterium]
MKRIIVLSVLGVAALVAAVQGVVAVNGAEEAASTDRGWVTLFDGANLDNWHISETSHHGNTQAWIVQDGAITGAQDKPGNGGIILTNDTFGDFLLELQLNPDWDLDSGIFLRSTEEGKCYQVMVDAYDSGHIGGVYGEGIGGFIYRPEEWKDHLNKGEWNDVQILVRGNPPSIDTWLNGHHLTEWHDDGEVKLDPTGHIGLQVHAGDGHFGKTTRFRNIRVLPLD